MMEKINQLLLCIFLNMLVVVVACIGNFFTKHKASQIGLRFFPRGEIMHIVKMHWRLLQIFFSKYLLIPAEVDCGFLGMNYEGLSRNGMLLIVVASQKRFPLGQSEVFPNDYMIIFVCCEYWWE